MRKEFRTVHPEEPLHADWQNGCEASRASNEEAAFQIASAGATFGLLQRRTGPMRRLHR